MDNPTISPFDRNPNPDITSQDLAMAEAARDGYLDVVKHMIDLGASDFNQAMFQAAVGGHLEIVKLMIEQGATNIDTCLLVAIVNGYYDIVVFMLNISKKSN